MDYPITQQHVVRALMREPSLLADPAEPEKQCRYPLCAKETEHPTSVCPQLNRRCGLCLHRGHYNRYDCMQGINGIEFTTVALSQVK